MTPAAGAIVAVMTDESEETDARYQDQLARAMALSKLEDEERSQQQQLIQRFHYRNNNNNTPAIPPTSSHNRWGQDNGSPNNNNNSNPRGNARRTNSSRTRSDDRSTKQDHRPVGTEEVEDLMEPQMASFLLDTDSGIGEDVHNSSSHNHNENSYSNNVLLEDDDDDDDDGFGDFDDGESMASTITGSFFTYRSGMETLGTSYTNSNNNSFANHQPPSLSSYQQRNKPNLVGGAIPKDLHIVPEAPRGSSVAGSSRGGGGGGGSVRRYKQQPQNSAGGPNPRRESTLSASSGPPSPPARRQSMSSQSQYDHEDCDNNNMAQPPQRTPVPYPQHPQSRQEYHHRHRDQYYSSHHQATYHHHHDTAPSKSFRSVDTGKMTNGTTRTVMPTAKSFMGGGADAAPRHSSSQRQQHSKLAGRTVYGHGPSQAHHHHHPGFDQGGGTPDYVLPQTTRPGAVHVTTAMPPRPPQRQTSLPGLEDIDSPTDEPQLLHGSFSSSAPPPSLIEISPGVAIPLREIEETLAAVANDHYVPVTCIGCNADIFCIADASYALCPECHSFTPLSGGTVSTRDRHGLGLGFSVENLFRMQADILASRRGAEASSHTRRGPSSRAAAAARVG